MKLMKKINWNWLFDSGAGNGIILIFVGIIFIFGNESLISSRTIGFVLIIGSILYLFNKIRVHFQVKKSKKSGEIAEIDVSHSKVAIYLENNHIKYIYKPKEEKLFEFYLPEYEVYVKYWEENFNSSKRDELTRYAKKGEIKFVEVFYDKLSSIELLHSSFMKKLSEKLKKK